MLPAAWGVIATVVDNAHRISPPVSVLPGDSAHPTHMLVFDERQGVTLASDFRVNISTPGSYETSTLSRGWIPAGTVIDSHFVHSDRPSGGAAVREATLTFPSDILGIIVGRGLLADTDPLLGAPGTSYPGGLPQREWETQGGDGVYWIDARTVRLRANTTTIVDQLRIITKHNAAPVPDAGGPYVGFEGMPVSLSGSAPDADGDPVTVSWSFSFAADPGTTCTPTGTSTLTPTITCTDDALVTATLSASDPYHAPATSTATITIGNLAPNVTSLTVPSFAVPVGGSVPISAVFTDAGANDTHTATIAWGDTTSSTGAVNQALKTVTGSHVYLAAGLYTITVTVQDDDLATAALSADVVVNDAPSADSGGPYSGDEGVAVGLVGSATDPEGDPMTYDWTFTPGAADPGTACTPTDTDTLTPTITCNDDVVVDVVLEASDAFNTSISAPTSVTFSNAAPVIGTLTTTAGPLIVGQSVQVTAPFTDTGTNDTHTAVVNWGDLTSGAAAVSEAAGSGSAAASHAYTTPGVYTITVTVTDDDGGSDTRSTFVVINSPPTADAGGPYAAFEGDTMTLSGSAGDADGDTLTISWSFAVSGGPGTVCNAAATSTLTPTLTCNDDAIVTATLSVSDGVYPAVTSSATVTVGNLAPVITSFTTSGVMNINDPAMATATFTDAGSNDTHVATIDWGDGNTTSGTIVGGTVTGSHTYAGPDLYTITITIVDDDGGTVTEVGVVYTVVYDPEGGRVSGGGHYLSPTGSYTPADNSDLDPITRVDFGFNVRYLTAGATTPSGHADFDFRAVGPGGGTIFEFKATAFDWLVVHNTYTSAIVAGTGTVNAASGYEFLLSIVDNGPGTPDQIRVRVKHTSSGVVLYDNQHGAPDNAVPLTQSNSGNSIQVHAP